jgi:hypothetical protein
MLGAIADAFGRAAITPPSAPHVIVNPDGTHSDLVTGFTSPDEIVALLEEASALEGDE